MMIVGMVPARGTVPAVAKVDVLEIVHMVVKAVALAHVVVIVQAECLVDNICESADK